MHVFARDFSAITGLDCSADPVDRHWVTGHSLFRTGANRGNRAETADCQLTAVGSASKVSSVQLTIDIPDKLAERLDAQPECLAEIIARGLHRSWSGSSSLRREVISFFAGPPTGDEIVGFCPSPQAAERSRELLQRNQDHALSAEEEAELDEICEIDRFVSLIKAEVLLQKSRRA